MFLQNQEKFQEVVQAAFERTQDNRRWQMAIVKAMQIIESNPFLHMDEQGTLIMLSPDSTEIYETTARECFRIVGEFRVHCRAFANGQPCKHRAAHRLLTRYMSE